MSLYARISNHKKDCPYKEKQRKMREKASIKISANNSINNETQNKSYN